MTRAEIKSMVAELAQLLGCDYGLYQFDSEKVVDAPYLIFDLPRSNDLYADDENYLHIDEFNLEYDSRFRDYEKEAIIEDYLLKHGFAWERTEGFVTGQNVYETMYSMEVIINAEE